jgi:hypothetical protein
VRRTHAKNKTAVVADTLTWKLLGDIKYVSVKNTQLIWRSGIPTSEHEVESMMHKKTVYHEQVSLCLLIHKNYALSKNVFAACFFCGKSGPETIAGIKV